MMQKHLAKHLLKQWASHENRELTKIDFPPVSPMFRDYTAGYRTSFEETERDRAAEKVGQALAIMQPALAGVLKKVYLDRARLPRKIHDIALHGFQRSWESLEQSSESSAVI